MEEKNPYSIEDLSKILESFNITKICSFDDDWLTFNPETGRNLDIILDESKLDQNLKDFYEGFGNDFTPYEDITSNENIDTVKDVLSSKNPDLAELVNECNRLLEQQQERDNPELTTLLNILQDLKDKGVPFEKSDSKVDATSLKDIEGRILFLLDMNMEKRTGDKDVIIESILNINKERPQKLDIIIVYSMEKLNHYKNHETKTQYVSDILETKREILNRCNCLDNDFKKYLLPYQLWSIEKKKDKNELISFLIETLDKAAFGHSLHDYLESKIQYNKKSMLELIKIPEEMYEELYRDAFVEGELFLKVLERTQESITNRVEWEFLKTDPSYKRVITNILKVVKEKDCKILREVGESNLTNYRKNVVKDKLDSKRYENISEYGLIDYSVNETFQDVSTGDLFCYRPYNEPEKLQFGIVITRDCDLVVRFPKTVSTVARKSCQITMLPCQMLQLSSEDGKKKIKDNYNNKNIVLWPIKNIEDNSYYLLSPLLNEFVQVDSRIFDLCSLNPNGLAKINFDDLLGEIQTFKTFHFNKHLNDNIRPWLEGMLKIDSYLPSLTQYKEVAPTESGIHPVNEIIAKTEKNTINLPAEILLELFIGLKYSIKFNSPMGMFDIRRVGRLEKRRTLQIIQGSVNSISEIGIPPLPLGS